eukprot:2288889-Prymnesium_polylepis.1
MLGPATAVGAMTSCSFAGCTPIATHARYRWPRPHRRSGRTDSNQDSRLLKLFADEQNPSAERQLAAHFDGLPQEQDGESPARNAVARVSAVAGRPACSVLRLIHSSTAYRTGQPTGHTKINTTAAFTVAAYSG